MPEVIFLVIFTDLWVVIVPFVLVPKVPSFEGEAGLVFLVTFISF